MISERYFAVVYLTKDESETCSLSFFHLFSVSRQSLQLEHVSLFSQGSALVFLALDLKDKMESRIDRQDMWKRFINSSVFKEDILCFGVFL